MQELWVLSRKLTTLFARGKGELLLGCKKCVWNAGDYGSVVQFERKDRLETAGMGLTTYLPPVFPLILQTISLGCCQL